MMLKDAIGGAAVAVCCLAQTPTPTPGLDQLTWPAIAQLGLSIVLVVAFVWQGFKREDRREQRIEKLEDDAKGYIQSIEKFGTAVADNTTAVRDLVSRLASRPCMRKGEPE